MKEIFNNLVDKSIFELAKIKIDVYTYAFYHDHESFAVSICVDTKENSIKSLLSQNEFTLTQFDKLIQEKDLKMASLFKYNTSRNFSLGDFKCVNMCRTDIRKGTAIDDQFYIDMVETINNHKEEIKKLSSEPEDVVFCCSTESDEVGLIWK
jgi:hypothetical protein